MTTYSYQEISNFIQDNSEKIDRITVSSFNQCAFNEREGYQVICNVNIYTVEGYKNKKLTLATNSTYFEWNEIEETAEALQDFLNIRRLTNGK